MKRKASHFLGSEAPAKIKKQSTSKTVHETLTRLKNKKSEPKPPLPLVKWPSSSQRQRKAPSWLSSYVTNTTQEKEVKNEKAKPKLPRFPTLVPPTKQKEVLTKKEKNSLQDKEGKNEKVKLPFPRFPTLVPPSKQKRVSSKEEDNVKVESPSLLRRKSTLKLQNSTESSTSEKKAKPLASSRASLTRKSTEILTSSTSSSDESIDSKYSEAPSTKKKSQALGKGPKSAHTPANGRNESELKGKKSVQSSEKFKWDEVDSTKNCSETIVEICDNRNFTKPEDNKIALNNPETLMPKPASVPIVVGTLPFTLPSQGADTIIIPEENRPNMLEVVICVSTSGALRDYLNVLQTRIREMVWRLQSLVPNLRIGVMAHTQGGIHDDPTRTTFGSGDHNYNRVGGHSGTKWIDLGATLSQICAFVDSLEPEPTVYPDYVQDNLEMALWKLQRCMSWSSCSYRTVIMIGRGRPNRTTFYMQKEHWRGWIRSALELKSTADIPVIDWELEAKLLAEMGIHVFTIQGTSNGAAPGVDDEGTHFFRRVAEITQGQHIKIGEPSRLVEIILGICCACHGPELLSDHRDTVRDDNDGVLPSQLTGIFVSLQLHSKSCSLASLPSMLGNLDIAGMRQRLTKYQSTIMECDDDEEESMEVESIRQSVPMSLDSSQDAVMPILENGMSGRKRKNKTLTQKREDQKHFGVKRGRVGKNMKVKNDRINEKVKQAVAAVTKKKNVSNSLKRTNDGLKSKEKFHLKVKPRAKSPGKVKKYVKELPVKHSASKRKAKEASSGAKKSKLPLDKSETPLKRGPGRPPGSKNSVKKAKAALALKANKNSIPEKRPRGRPRKVPLEKNETKVTNVKAAVKKNVEVKQNKLKSQQNTVGIKRRFGLSNVNRNANTRNRNNRTEIPWKNDKIITRKKRN